VTPLALLVPIFGLGSAVLVGQESLAGWKLLAAALVIIGLAVTVWGGSRSEATVR
jgi:O-acetylserine/cysteine efflux transporter